MTYHKTRQRWRKLINRKRRVDYAGFSVKSVISVYSGPHAAAEPVVPVLAVPSVLVLTGVLGSEGFYMTRRNKTRIVFLWIGGEMRRGNLIRGKYKVPPPLLFLPPPESVQFSAPCRLHSQGLCLRFREGHTHSAYKNKSGLAWQYNAVNRLLKLPFQYWCHNTRVMAFWNHLEQ